MLTLSLSRASGALEDELDKSHFMEQQKYQQSGSLFASRLVEQKAEQETFFYSIHRRLSALVPLASSKQLGMVRRLRWKAKSFPFDGEFMHQQLCIVK